MESILGIIVLLLISWIILSLIEWISLPKKVEKIGDKLDRIANILDDKL